MGTRLAFDDIPFETPEARTIPRGEYILDDQDDLYQGQTRTPQTVRFAPSVNQGQRTLDEDYGDDRRNPAVPFRWDREEQAAVMHGCPGNDSDMEFMGRISPKEAFRLVQSRIAPPDAPLCPALHVMFPAPRGSLSRRELCDQLVSMFNLDRIVTAQAVSWMDPANEGIDFAAFRELMQAGKEYGGLVAATPKTPRLSSSIQDRRDKRSAVKQPPPPLEPEWLPKVHQHIHKDTIGHLGPGFVPRDENEGIVRAAMQRDFDSHIGPGMVPEEGAAKGKARGLGGVWGYPSGMDHLEPSMMPEEGASQVNNRQARQYDHNPNRSSVQHCIG
mmetsp:Transcript_3109/g.6473  ORF Transcript_3109/g.6473 Transcript_3109/m.6473 type:complete len:330 (-) Transcript_3109:49-1038(-)